MKILLINYKNTAAQIVGITYILTTMSPAKMVTQLKCNKFQLIDTVPNYNINYLKTPITFLF